METVHRFTATKSQYIRKLASWKIKKNATSIDWKKAAIIIDKRKRQGKESEIYVDGKLIPSKKMKKETARHWPSYLESIEMSAHEIDLPGDFVVQTPPATTLHPIQPHRSSFAGPGFDNVPMDLLTNLLVGTHDSTTIATASQMLQHYDRILPLNLSDRFPTADNSLGDESWTYFILCLAYLASNNLLESKQIGGILEWIDSTKNAQLIQALLQLKGPTIESCASVLFSEAVCNGPASIVQFFLLNEYDPNTRIHHHSLEIGSTGLEIAIIMGNNSVIRLLLKHGADPNKCGDRPLHPVIQNGNDANDSLYIASYGSLLALYIDYDCDEDIIQLFLDAGANIDGESAGLVMNGDDEKDYYFINYDNSPEGVPLVKAAYRGNTQVAQFLLEAGANVDQVDIKWGSAIQTAVKNGDMDMAELLVEAGADINLSKEPYSHAWFFDGPGHVPMRLFSPLQLATRARNFDMVQYLLRCNADTNGLPALDIIEKAPYAEDMVWGDYETPLSYAVLESDLDIATLLLDSGADPNAVSLHGHTALGAACREENLWQPDMVKLLLDNGAEPQCHLGPELQLAILHGDLILVDDLLQKGVDINAPPYFKGKRTALQAAAETGNASLFNYLLFLGADFNSPGAGEKILSCLQAAMLSGNDEIIKMILKYGGAATAESILCAVKIRSSKMIDLLMGLGADVNTPGIADLSLDFGPQLVTPLVLAIDAKDFDMVHTLLRSGANVSHIYCESESILPLHQAIRARDLRITRTLLSHGSDPNQVEPFSGETGLGTATSSCVNYWSHPISFDEKRLDLKSMTAIIRELIDHKADVNLMTKGRYLLEDVIMNDELLKIFIEAGADIHALGGISLARAICRGSSATRLLLDFGVDLNRPDQKCGTPLQAAITVGNFGLVSELFERGADVNAGLNNLLAYAIDLQQLHIVELLLEKGANTNGISLSKHDWFCYGRQRPSSYVGDRTALVAAAEQNNFDLVKALIERGANVEADNAQRGSSPLQAASINDNLPMVRLLLENGAEVNAKPRGSRLDETSTSSKVWSSGRRTALQAASENRNLQLAKLLIERGAKVNMKPYEDEGATGLQLAAKNGDIQMAVLLLEHGADINGPRASRNGRTALEGAAEHGRLDMVHLLLQNDQDETDLEVRCEEAAKYAERRGHLIIAKILSEWTHR
ncbi:unnamed protein product [Clonostachys byssicola]|uniref:Clr5 domain-containing protein n=1 Tax=Clonostachys byssicola TaxID=160290 RepID=A0A9N9Y261_9HYPO|nr:unnamed protein product [Clonostachys byssicola]